MKHRWEKYHHIGKLIKYVSKHKGRFIASIVAGVLKNIFMLLSLLLGAYLTGMAFVGRSSQEILALFPYLLLSIVARGLLSYIHMLVCHQVAYYIIEDLRVDLYDSIERNSPLSMEKYRTGVVSSIVMEDVETLEAFLAHIMGDYIIALLCMVLYVFLYSLFSFEAALLSLVASIIIATVPYWFGKANQHNADLLRTKLGITNAGVVDTIQGLKEIIIFGREKKYINKVMDETMDLNQVEVRDGKRKGLQAGIMNFTMSAVLIGVIYLANAMAIRSELPPEYIGVFIVFALNIFLPVVIVSNTAGKINLVAASANRIDTLLNEKPKVLESSKKYPEIETENIIDVCDISFAYEKGRDVFNHISFSISQGENVAITGPSGIGKTTLIHLLMRFYDPDQGAIYLKGKDIRTLPLSVLRKEISFVPQDVFLFHGTILENITLGRPDATMEEVIRASRIAMADGFIQRLEHGYDTAVGERGTTLSGGQKQRIAIARALLMEAPILIMDEAVSNLDTQSEKLFRQALANISQEKTLITIAHRKSTIEEASRVLNMEDLGKILT